jgi:hypothetical protein
VFVLAAIVTVWVGAAESAEISHAVRALDRVCESCRLRRVVETFPSHFLELRIPYSANTTPS